MEKKNASDGFISQQMWGKESLSLKDLSIATSKIKSKDNRDYKFFFFFKGIEYPMIEEQTQNVT